MLLSTHIKRFGVSHVEVVERVGNFSCFWIFTQFVSRPDILGGCCSDDDDYDTIAEVAVIACRSA